MRQIDLSRHFIVLLGILWLDRRLYILYKRSRTSRMKWIVRKRGSVGPVRHYARGREVHVRIRYRIGVGIVVLRWDIVAWGIKSRHDVTAGEERQQDCEVTVDDDGPGRWNKINVIPGRPAQGLEAERPGEMMARPPGLRSATISS